MNMFKLSILWLFLIKVKQWDNLLNKYGKIKLDFIQNDPRFIINMRTI